MDNNIINTYLDLERVTSTYADIYFNDDYCKSKLLPNEVENKSNPCQDIDSEWMSPSDFLIGKVELNPPFTSKITRGKTHEGIVAIGNENLEKDHNQFMASVADMLSDNDETWNHVLVNEKKLIAKQVKQTFQHIFKQKTKIMNEEIMKFYENTLQELELHLQSEMQKILDSVHASIISNLNIEIPSKLKKERIILEKYLEKKYKAQVDKILMYYKFLLANEEYQNNKLINYALTIRNDALRAFCRQIDAERLTTSMYVMSMERKKCKIKKLFLENYQSTELAEKVQKIKEKQDIIESFKEKEKKALDINKEWEDKMKRVLELFFKFISFSLKLLPEQSAFLLDFQKMVVLQMNEMKKYPDLQPNILIDEDNLANDFEFQSSVFKKKECETEPFTLIGDLSDPVPPTYGSTETLPSDVNLPFIRVNRQHIYAKCHGFEEIQNLLKSQQCLCAQRPSPTSSDTTTIPEEQILQPTTPTESASSNEPLLIDDIHRLEDCPARKCQQFRNIFPFLPAYVDYSEQNFERVKTILGQTPSVERIPELISAKNIADTEIPFAETKEPYRHAETQYSSQNFEILTNVSCTCFDEYKVGKNTSSNEITKPESQILTEALAKRKISLRRLLEDNPNMLKIFTDESVDF